MDKTKTAKIHSENVSTIVTGIKIDLDFENKNAENCISCKMVNRKKKTQQIKKILFL